MLRERKKRALGEASESAFKAAENVDEFSVSAKHLMSAGGRYRKFATDSIEEVRAIVRDALKSPNAQFYPNNQPDSLIVLTDLGKAIGTNGETIVKVVVGIGGKIWTAYPK